MNNRKLNENEPRKRGNRRAKRENNGKPASETPGSWLSRKKLSLCPIGPKSTASPNPEERAPLEEATASKGNNEETEGEVNLGRGEESSLPKSPHSSNTYKVSTQKMEQNQTQKRRLTFKLNQLLSRT